MPIDNYISRHWNEGPIYLLEPFQIPWYHNYFNLQDYPFYYIFRDIFLDIFTNIQYHKIITLFHLYVLTMGVIFLSRTFTLPLLNSFFVGILVAVSYYVFGWSSWDGALIGLVWFPYYFACLYRFLVLNIDITSNVLGGAIFASFIAVSDSRALIFVVFITIACIIGSLFKSISDRSYAVFKQSSFKLMACAILGFLMASPKIVEVFSNADSYTRWFRTIDHDVNSIRGIDKLPNEALLINQRTGKELLTSVIFPCDENKFKYFSEDYLGSEYVGVLSFFLAILGFVKMSGNVYFKLFTIVSLYFLFSGAGQNLGIFYLNKYIPLINSVRYPVYLYYLFILLNSIFAGFGLKMIFDYKVNSRLFNPIFATTIFFSIYCFFIYFISNDIILKDKIFLYIVFMLSGLILINFVPYISGRLKFSMLVVICILAIASQKFQKQHRYSTIGNSLYFKESIVSAHLVFNYLKNDSEHHNYRIAFEGSQKSLRGSQALYYDIGSISFYMSPHMTQQFEIFKNRGSIRRYMQFLGVKYLAIDSEVCPSAFTDSYLVGRFGDLWLFESDVVFPKYSLVNGVVPYIDEQEIIDSISEGFDFLNKCFIRRSDFKNLKLNAELKGFDEQKVTEIVDEISLKEFIVESGSNTILCLNFQYDKNWKVLVDGVMVEPVIINLGQIGIALDAGTHRVDMKYIPQRYIVLRLLSKILLICSLFIIIYLFVSKRKLFFGSKRPIEKVFL